jgi:hypothetical protein
VYADGFLGHVYRDDETCEAMLRRMRRWLARGGLLVISNDAVSEPESVRPAPNVPGFHWLSSARIERWLRVTGNEITAVEEFVYQRPLTGLRRRAIVTARRCA